MSWERICKNINRYAITDTESEFEGSLCDLLLEGGLKWGTKDIKRQDIFRIGSSQSVRPDIIIYENNKPQFIIEVKKPSHIQTENDITQLISYMKQLEVNVGIYIGEKIEVFYKEIGAGTLPERIIKTSFQTPDDDGEIFYDLFNYQNFSQVRIKEFYAKKIEEKKEKDIIEKETSLLISDKGSLIELFLLNHFISRGLKEDIAHKILSSIEISINRKDQPSTQYTSTESNKINQTSNLNKGPNQSIDNPKSKKNKRPPFKFSMIGLFGGEEITFIPTDQKLKVVGENKVEFNGIIDKLTPMAKRLMPQELRTPSEAYQGPDYFCYKGRKLTDLRKEMEK